MFSKNPRWSKSFGRSELDTISGNDNGNLSNSRSKPKSKSKPNQSRTKSKKSPSDDIPLGKSMISQPRPKKESLSEFLKKSREARSRFEKTSKEASDFRQLMKMNFQKLKWEREKIRKVRLESWVKQQMSLVKIRDRLADIIERLEDQQEKEKEKSSSKSRSKVGDFDFEASFFGIYGTNGKKSSSKRRKNNKYETDEYNIITGGKFGLGYRNLVQNPEKGKTFSIDIDISGYLEKEISIETEENRMIIKGLKEDTKHARTMTIIAPRTEDIEGMIIKPPNNGILTIEAP